MYIQSTSESHYTSSNYTICANATNIETSTYVLLMFM